MNAYRCSCGKLLQRANETHDCPNVTMESMSPAEYCAKFGHEERGIPDKTTEVHYTRNEDVEAGFDNIREYVGYRVNVSCSRCGEDLYSKVEERLVGSHRI